MIIYNVTINIDESVHEEWLDWMKNKHIPDVMATGLFTAHKILRLLSRQEDETGYTYAIQYTCLNLDNYEKYQSTFAPGLQAETQQKFGGKFGAYRSLLEEV